MYKKSTALKDPRFIADRKYSLPLLKHVLGIQTYSYDDENMMNYLKSALNLIKDKFKFDLLIQEDGYGNIYVTKGSSKKYPALVSHTDTVHRILQSYRVFQHDDTLFAYNSKLRKTAGIGGDDKVGVFTCLQALIDIDILKVVFYKNEEVGCIGSRYSIEHHKKFYEDCSFVLQCDRRGATDFITRSAGIKICSDDFYNACLPYLKSYGFTKAVGISTDVDKLVSGNIGISCVNISSSYFSPHTDNESVSVEGVGNTYSLVYALITNLFKTTFKHKYTPIKLSNYKYAGGSSKRDFNWEEYYSKRYGPKNKMIVSQVTLVDNVYSINGLGDHLTSKSCQGCNKGYYELKSNKMHFECTHCGVITYDKSYFKNLKVKLNFGGNKGKKEYVFSWFYNGWVEYNKAIWSPKIKCYVPEKKYIENWELER